jgi:catechol 2,3-dioxygenase-like lactoylglutathione lyase family enzyme
VIDRFHHLYIEPSDYEASLAFYQDVLGWSPTENWVDEDSLRGAILSGGGVKVVIAERRGVTANSAGGADGARFTAHLDIHDVDARFKALPKGDHVVVEPQATHWGTRWFVVRDPDGNRIAFEEVHGHGG